MGTIVSRKRKDGTFGYTAQIVVKRKGSKPHREAKTFDRKQAAKAWIAKRETEIREKGVTAEAEPVILSDAIDQYTKESAKEIGKTKAQVLRSIKGYEIAGLECDQIASQDIVEFARELSAGRDPSTVGNYISHLAAIFAVARPAWGYPLDRQAMEDAQIVLRRLGIIAKSKQRDRRPTLDELDTIMTHFAERQVRIPQSMPMHQIIAFAIFSTRRQEEIVRIEWNDLDEKHSRVLVRDMKNPGEKIGNDVWCDLTPEALTIIQAMPHKKPQIFPYSADAISTAFTRACKFLQIKNLHFHDLRHDGISRLFEIGWGGGSIPHIAAVSGHRSWSSLQRYTHIRQKGDKYAGWKWLAAVAK